MNRLARWPVAVATAADRLLNAALLGDDRQTLSSRAFYAREKRAWWGWVADVLDGVALRVFGQDHHCRRAAEFDARQLTPGERAR